MGVARCKAERATRWAYVGRRYSVFRFPETLEQQRNKLLSEAQRVADNSATCVCFLLQNLAREFTGGLAPFIDDIFTEKTNVLEFFGSGQSLAAGC